MVRGIFVAARAVRRSQSKCVLAASERLAPVSRRKRLLGARAMPQQRPGGWRCWIRNAVGRVTPCVAPEDETPRESKALYGGAAAFFAGNRCVQRSLASAGHVCSFSCVPRAIRGALHSVYCGSPSLSLHAMLPAKSPRSLLNPPCDPSVCSKTAGKRLFKAKKNRTGFGCIDCQVFFATREHR